ncbi:MAG: aspartate aminotransferase family protein [Clostridiales bacterium]|nr:aspartate aminotransferase family protein [Clostridiales bacterium]
MEETNAKIITAVPGPKSQELLTRHIASVPRGVSNSTGVFATQAKGALIKDVDGNVFVDFTAGIGVANAGHCPDEVVGAIRRQAGEFIHTSINCLLYDPYTELAERLQTLSPVEDSKVLFINSGAEAVENAVKIAKKYTGRSAIAVVEGSFHGRTHLTMSMTAKATPYKDGFGPFVPDIATIPCPNLYRKETSMDDENYALSCADKFHRMLQTSLSPETVACVVVEPVQGEGGFIPMHSAFLKRLQSICKQYGIVFIVDEIQTGIARTGTLFASEQLGISPDLLISSKSLAAGLPLSCVIGKKEIMDAPIPGAIGGTFSGNPVACAAAQAVLDNVEKYRLCERAKKLGDYLMRRLSGMKSKYDAIGDVRGLGAMLGMEFVKDRATKEPDKGIIGTITSKSLRQGAIFISAGLLSNVIRLLPPLVMTEDQASFGMDVLDDAIGYAISNQNA